MALETRADRPQYTGCDLAKFLRSVADHVDRPDVIVTSLTRKFDVVETAPEPDKDDQLWRTYEHTGGGSLSVYWTVKKKKKPWSETQSARGPGG